MRLLPLIAVIAALLSFWGGEAAAQGRAAADVSCRPAGAPLQYDCAIRLTEARSKTPLTGATVTIGADMPSMPMAHNVRPRKATPSTEPGLYEVRLELEMNGDWVLRIDVTGPVRDRVVVPLSFEDNAVRPTRPARAAPHRGH
jgi:YtkA-like